jgi:hypothetical protein
MGVLIVTQLSVLEKEAIPYNAAAPNSHTAEGRLVNLFGFCWRLQSSVLWESLEVWMPTKTSKHYPKSKTSSKLILHF